MTLWRKTGWALVVLANAVLAQGCKEPIKGVALGLFDTELSSRAIRTELESIQALGANTISLPIYWYQQDVTSHEIRPYPEAGFDPVRYDDLVRTAIHQAHGVGLGVLLMPVVQLEQTGKGKWRGALQPVSWDLWFQSYEHFLLHYARLAQEEEVTLFSVGSELSSSEVHVTRWRALIDRVRAIYRGELTYSANWDHYHQVAFWDKVDYLGTSAYYELIDEVPTTYAALHLGWQRIRRDLEKWQQTVGKPLLITEIGYPSTSTAARTPWDYTGGTLDLQQQRLCYRAFIEAWRGSRSLAGTFLWIWEPGRGGPADRGYAWRGKPAEAEIAAWYRGR
jgi:hypothetical protein